MKVRYSNFITFVISLLIVYCNSTTIVFATDINLHNYSWVDEIRFDLLSDDMSTRYEAVSYLIDNIERRDVWQASLSLNYVLFSWPTSSLRYDYRQEDYDYQEDPGILDEDFIDNRVTLSFTAAYSSKPVSF